VAEITRVSRFPQLEYPDFWGWIAKQERAYT
jgi:hypothetical protein